VIRLSTISPTGTPQSHPIIFPFNWGIRDASTKPDTEEVEKDDAKNKSDDGENRDADQIKRVHVSKLPWVASAKAKAWEEDVVAPGT
jgi:hypothetical protein